MEYADVKNNTAVIVDGGERATVYRIKRGWVSVKFEDGDTMKVRASRLEPVGKKIVEYKKPLPRPDTRGIVVGARVKVGGNVCRVVTTPTRNGWFTAIREGTGVEHKIRVTGVERVLPEKERDDSDFDLKEFNKYFPRGSVLRHGDYMGWTVDGVDDEGLVRLSNGDADAKVKVLYDALVEKYPHNFQMGDYVLYTSEDDLADDEEEKVVPYRVEALLDHDTLLIREYPNAESVEVSYLDVEPYVEPEKKIGAVVQIPPRAVRTAIDLTVIRSVLQSVCDVKAQVSHDKREKAVVDTLYNLCVTKEEFDFFYALLDNDFDLPSDLEDWLAE